MPGSRGYGLRVREWWVDGALGGVGGILMAKLHEA